MLVSLFLTSVAQAAVVDPRAALRAARASGHLVARVPGAGAAAAAAYHVPPAAPVAVKLDYTDPAFGGATGVYADTAALEAAHTAALTGLTTCTAARQTLQDTVNNVTHFAEGLLNLSAVYTLTEWDAGAGARVVRPEVDAPGQAALAAVGGPGGLNAAQQEELDAYENALALAMLANRQLTAPAGGVNPLPAAAFPNSAALRGIAIGGASALGVVPAGPNAF